MKREEFEVVGGPPEALTDAERQRFRDLVILGGEVGGAALSTNIANATALVTLNASGTIRGVAALKRPQASYRKKITDRSGFALPLNHYPYELGYLYIAPTMRGRGLSHLLIAEALDHRDNKGVFATAREDNAPMRAALIKAGFELVGRPYPGRDNRAICLFVSPDRTEET